MMVAEPGPACFVFHVSGTCYPGFGSPFCLSVYVHLPCIAWWVALFGTPAGVDGKRRVMASDNVPCGERTGHHGKSHKR